MSARAANPCCPACGRRLTGTRLSIETRRGYGILAAVHPPHNH
jgi:hypothetical protein